MLTKSISDYEKEIAEYKAALEKQLKLKKQTQELALIGDWTWDLGTKEIIWSEMMYKIYDLPSDTQLSLDLIRSMQEPGSTLEFDVLLQECLNNGTPYDYRNHLISGSRRRKTLRSKGYMLYGDDGVPLQIFGTVQDVTDQLKKEQLLEENQKFSQKIADLAPSIINIYNIPSATYTFTNSAIVSLLGYSTLEVSEGGQELFLSVIHQDDVAELQQSLSSYVELCNLPENRGRHDLFADFRFRIQHKKGGYKWLHTRTTIFNRDSKGQLLDILNISNDITDKMLYADGLMEENKTLSQSNSSLEEFAYMASHDMQEPLRKISSFGNLLQTQEQNLLTDKGRLYVEKMVSSAKRMQEMVNDLLKVATITGDIAFQPCEMQQILDEALQNLEAKIEKTATKILVKKPLPLAMAIPSQINQLFQNLLSNSIKFASKDRPPSIVVDWKEVNVYPFSDKAYVSAPVKMIELEFSDNGIGFSTEKSDKIFRIFQRLNGKSEYEGSGIGLAICKKIVEHHNGLIKVESKLGVGTTFLIQLPII